MVVKLSLEELENRYNELKTKLGRIPKRGEMNFTMSMRRRFNMSWRQFIEHMGDECVGSKYSNEELKNIILEFSKKHKRPPSSDEMTRPSSKVFQNRFGSWSAALHECGFEVAYPTYIADDGHKCFSRMELYVDNYLFHNGIKHDKDVYYPYHKLYNTNSKKTCDWKLADGRYVEMFGLMQRKYYSDKVDIKKQLCESLNLSLVEIYPEDLSKLKEII
jgi:hypothetical protein